MPAVFVKGPNGQFTISCLAMALTIISTQCTYPQRDGQLRLRWHIHKRSPVLILTHLNSYQITLTPWMINFAHLIWHSLVRQHHCHSTDCWDSALVYINAALPPTTMIRKQENHVNITPTYYRELCCWHREEVSRWLRGLQLLLWVWTSMSECSSLSLPEPSQLHSAVNIPEITYYYN